MSLTPTPPPQLRLGIIASRNLDAPEFLHDLLSEKVAAIFHLYTNGVNPLVTEFALEHGLPHTVFPAQCSNTLKSNGQIVSSSDFVLIISDQDSKNAPLVKKECEEKGVKHRIVLYDSASFWKTKMAKVKSLVEGATKEELEASVALRAIGRAVSPPSKT